MADDAGRGGKPGRRGGSTGGPDRRDRSGAGRPHQGRGASGATASTTGSRRAPGGATRATAASTTGVLTARALTPAGSTAEGQRPWLRRAWPGPRIPGRARRRAAPAASPGGGQRAQRPGQGRRRGRAGLGLDVGHRLLDRAGLRQAAHDHGPAAGPAAVLSGRDTPPDPRADRGSRPGRADDGRADTGPQAAGARSSASRAGGSSRGGAALPDDSTALLPRRHAPTARLRCFRRLGPGPRGGERGTPCRVAAGGARPGRPGPRRPAVTLAGPPPTRARVARRTRTGAAARRPALACPPRGQDPRAQDASLSALARLGTPAGGPGGRQAPLDDDPLTSPSFPAIRSDDSRSYRRTDNPGGRRAGSNGSNGSNGSARAGWLRRAGQRRCGQRRGVAGQWHPARADRGLPDDVAPRRTGPALGSGSGLRQRAVREPSGDLGGRLRAAAARRSGQRRRSQPQRQRHRAELLPAGRAPAGRATRATPSSRRRRRRAIRTAATSAPRRTATRRAARAAMAVTAAT